MEVRWLGHATTCVRLDGTTILTDPALRPRMAGLVRHAAQPQASAWQEADAILISHGHHDHLDLPSLRLLGADVHVIVPHGLGAFIRRAGVRHISELKVGDRLALGAVTVEAVKARHAGTRMPRGPSAPAVGYVIEGSRRAYFAGDTGLFDGMDEIGRRGVDLALLPVGGWGPRLRGGHLDPASAAEALTLLRPSGAVPIHWGTFWPTGMRWIGRDRFEKPGRQFMEHAAAVAPEVEVTVLTPGETVTLPDG